jgi:hypothetical protein
LQRIDDLLFFVCNRLIRFLLAYRAWQGTNNLNICTNERGGQRSKWFADSYKRKTYSEITAKRKSKRRNVQNQQDKNRRSAEQKKGKKYWLCFFCIKMYKVATLAGTLRRLTPIDAGPFVYHRFHLF